MGLTPAQLHPGSLARARMCVLQIMKINGQNIFAFIIYALASFATNIWS